MKPTPNKPTAPNSAMAPQFHAESCGRRVVESDRWAESNGGIERAVMKVWSSLFFVALVTATACHHEPAPSAALSRKGAEKLMAEIRPGMTLRQILVVVPHPCPRPFAGEQVSDDYIIQIRLTHPTPGSTLEQSIINYSPRLRDRKTFQFISGSENSW